MRPRLFMLDNIDSFTWNLVQACRSLGARVRVARNDEITLDAVLALRPTHVVISPGPGRPEGAGLTLALLEALVLREALGPLPVLGVCLGHQALAQLLGGRVVAARALIHGKSSLVRHDHKGVFQGLPDPAQMGRYHSLAVDAASLPPTLEASAWSEDGELMGLRHTTLPVEGVQFHPESVMSPHGARLLENFMSFRATRRTPG